MKTKKLLFLVMTVFSIAIQNAFALGSIDRMFVEDLPNKTPAQIDARVKQVITDSAGGSFQVALIKYKNLNNSMEVRIEAAAIPRFASKINPLLGFGRDLNGNGKIDTWFLITRDGIVVVEKEGKDSRGRDALGDILLKKYRSTFFMYATSATTSIFS